jgi:hypothetical protein
MASAKPLNGTNFTIGYKMKLLFAAILMVLPLFSSAQTRLISDFSSTMRIPGIVNMQTSATHMYVLSEDEGLIVFRTNTDTLQWILTSEGMSARGTRMRADVRFAYLYGAGTRLTVLEPTSLLGVYSSSFLPNAPVDVFRAGTTLYVAMGEGGLAKMSLASPAAFDQPPIAVETGRDSPNITSLAGMQLEVIALDSGRNLIFYDISGEELTLGNTVPLSREVDRLHVLDHTLYASTFDGQLFEVRSTGQLRPYADIGEPIEKIMRWSDMFLVRTESGRLLGVDIRGNISFLRTDREAGNYFVLVNNRLWISNYSELSLNSLEVRQSPVAAGQTSPSGAFRVGQISDMVVPFPRPILIPLSAVGARPGEIRFQFRSDVTNAEIRGQGFFWQPQTQHIGINRFIITATNSAGVTDSTSFIVDVRAFNAPPRFNPLRPLSVVVGENFQLPIRAIDPDGLDRELIRYHGVDLPEGASISERTGMFMWTPDRRQVGNHQFQIIATDQFGAASALPVSITVRNLSREENGESF